MRRLLAILMCFSVIVPTGCASSGRTAVNAAPARTPAGTAAMADYVRKLPPGSRVRVERVDGHTLRGTLLRADADAIVVQASTRIPEPPVEMAMAHITRVTLETGTGMSTGKAIGIGVASGVGAFFAILAILAATFSD